MDKEDVVHIYNGILLSHRKEQNCVICRNTDGLETAIQSEVSQKEKNKYRTSRLYAESRKMTQMNLFAKQK